MHEWGIVESLLERVDAEARAHDASAVRAIRLRVGELAGVEVDLLRKAFLAFRERTVCRDADLLVESATARWACPRCGREPGAGDLLHCRDCDLPSRLVDGGEIVLERIEMEVA